ncbi:MAG: hypothetical protein H7839_02220 [Magnetococcus sp. YQC-5]
MQNQIEVMQFREYEKLDHTVNRPFKKTFSDLLEERYYVIQAIKRRAELIGALGLSPHFGHVPKNVIFPSPISEQLWQERRLLAEAWLVLRKNPKNHKIAHLLDHYLYAKNLFIARHVQSPWGITGLTEFRGQFKRAKLINNHTTPRLQWLDHSRKVYFAAESAHLRHIEFRIAPFDSPREYASFFSNWSTFASSDPFLLRRNISITFVIHFIRQPIASDEQAETPFHDLLITLDRQSAAMHQFRQDYPHQAKLLVGIDVANLERTCPPHLFTPYLNLLRGMPVDFSCGPYMQHWCELKRINRHLLTPTIPPLGITFHAGEDYYHIVDGLRTMDSALSGLKMGAGDRIGHGLAAGRSVKHFDLEYGDSLSLPAGDAMDNLIWLYDQLTHLPQNRETELRRLREEIEISSEHLYGEIFTPAQFMRAFRYRHDVPKRFTQREMNDDDAKKIRFMELYDLTVRRRRNKIIRSPDIFRDLSPSIEAAQESIMRKIAKLGVVIEFNPSSNFITGGMETLAYHPYFKYQKVLDGKLRATINCDDPGTFGTRIENEFSCIFHALINQNHTREEALSVLNAMRKTANDYSFCAKC